jgi:hypothetical protein
MKRQAARSQKKRRAQLNQLRRLRLTRVNKQTLDAAREITGSDSATAHRIGVSKQLLSNIRHGRRPMPPYVAVKLARILKRQPIPDLLHALYQVAKSDRNREHWLDMRSGLWPGRQMIYENWASSQKKVKYPCI